MAEKVIDKREKFAAKRATHEKRLLTEVNAYVNHHPQSRVAAGMTHSKTMHHGVDLCSVLAKYDKLAIQHKFHPKRFRFGISERILEKPTKDSTTERQAVLIVDMPEGWYVLSNDDFVVLMTEFPEKIIETAEKVGRWEVVGAEV